jgi:hypothetical protein
MIPAELEPYWGLILLGLTFVDGLIFGIALKKAVSAIVYIIIGLLLAGFIGLTLPLPSSQTLLEYALKMVPNIINKIGPIAAGLPILFIIGFLVGLLKG